PGLIVSAGAHAALLVAALVSFSGAPKLPDAQEATPVDIITDSQFNEVTNGRADAPKEALKPLAEKQDEIIDTKPDPVRNEAKVDVPTPPSPLKREPDPGEDETPPTPPARVAALPPPEPAKPTPAPPTPPARPEPPRVETKPEPPKPEPPKVEPPKPEQAEAVEPPRPPQRPRPPKPEPKPEPKQEAKAEVKPPPKPAPKPEPKPAEKPPEKPQLRADRIAAVLAEKKADEKPVARPKSGEEAPEQQRKFDPGSISKLLSKEDPSQKASTGRTPNRTASLGAANASAPRMSPSLWGQLDGYLQEQYKRCWAIIPTAGAGRYVPQIQVAYTQTGALVGEPKLRNPPNDPAMRAIADSALRAVRNPLCNPMRIPAQFQPYYEEWKERILRFDPEEMMG
ncbi:MAG TPA: cell envelope biogenesis protein TolA, partial [Beijerinckiaceae bacterium]